MKQYYFVQKIRPVFNFNTTGIWYRATDFFWCLRYRATDLGWTVSEACAKFECDPTIYVLCARYKHSSEPTFRKTACYPISYPGGVTIENWSYFLDTVVSKFSDQNKGIFWIPTFYQVRWMQKPRTSPHSTYGPGCFAICLTLDTRISVARFRFWWKISTEYLSFFHKNLQHQVLTL